MKDRAIALAIGFFFFLTKMDMVLSVTGHPLIHVQANGEDRERDSKRDKLHYSLIIFIFYSFLSSTQLSLFYYLTYTFLFYFFNTKFNWVTNNFVIVEEKWIEYFNLLCTKIMYLLRTNQGMGDSCNTSFHFCSY